MSAPTNCYRCGGNASGLIEILIDGHWNAHCRRCVVEIRDCCRDYSSTRKPTESEMKTYRWAVLFAACTQVNCWNRVEATIKWEKEMEVAQRSLNGAVKRYQAANALLEAGKVIT